MSHSHRLDLTSPAKHLKACVSQSRAGISPLQVSVSPSPNCSTSSGVLVVVAEARYSGSK